MSCPYKLVSVRDRLVPYVEGLKWQNDLHTARRRGESIDTALVLEHAAVVTIGRGSHPNTDFLRPRADLELDGIAVYESDRGGEMTYHAPGQLVVYLIFQLEEEAGERDLHRYLRNLEQVIIDSLAAFGVVAERKTGLTGVWVGNRKIAAIGIKVSRWVTMHGFALNIDVDLTPMRRDIIPCGIRDRGVTSLSELGLNLTRSDVEPILIGRMESILNRRAQI